MKVEVVRAWPGRYELIALDLPPGSRVADALRESGMGDDKAAVAVFGVVSTLQVTLHDGDRVELLRPLLIDPKQARRRRAKAAKAAR